MKKQKTNEGVLAAVDRFVAAFFRGLEQNTADKVIKKAERAKLPPDVIKRMDDINKRVEDFKNSVKDL